MLSPEETHKGERTMRPPAFLLPAACVPAALLVPCAAQAHFQEILPDQDILPDEGDRIVRLSIVFTHPMEGGPTMDMGKPEAFGVLADGRKIDLRAALQPTSFKDKKAYDAAYKVEKPGDYVFYVVPAPYWEPAEKHFLIHYSKVIVDFGSADGWDQMVGLPMEIEPLTRPYGLWTGNLFRGVVRHDGKPLAGGRVEVEWVNDGSVKAPSDPFVTQVLKTDAAGAFAYAFPRAGWWGINAIYDGRIKGPDGKPVDAELGGTIWLHVLDMK
jgi:cobalt/nickel transport protein